MKYRFSAADGSEDEIEIVDQDGLAHGYTTADDDLHDEEEEEDEDDGDDFDEDDEDEPEEDGDDQDDDE